ncbi:Gfo/Idh/MocA family protein [Paenibacillus sp. JDR-2]|uniref:Gfo/Idh/MocA family protein n=1 Tax=Paenibacillus sp. (strain JDR-2) TaxID=324057 RepID=UPI0001666753|nr:Gfo/Idh/MocA family oxidoreductase [Paenibacillus sp. JDR-2]ACS99840.1 oxidoreductase domain protein [Paenibacillus sp. JDR-2]
MKLGVIGYGSRIQHVIQEMIKLEPACTVTAIVDPQSSVYRQQEPQLEQHAAFYDTPEEMLASADLDGILIGTRCNLHTEMALKVFPTSIPLFLEKPVATTMEDLLRLKAGAEEWNPPVIVSFPLRVCDIVQVVKEIVDSGKIGTIEHVQAVNNVPYGSVYFHNWYRDESLTGGLFLQKATHDFDYINHVLQNRPVSVCAMTSKQIYKGEKLASLHCYQCDEKDNCPDSAAYDQKMQCVFATDTGNEDSGSALITYDTGMHVSYSQNFFARRGAAARGARFLGYKGTVEFDFYTETVKVFMHHTDRIETYQIKSDQSHFGGDKVLARNFIDMIQHNNPSISPIEDGLLSALQCLKARESAETKTFRAINWD